MSDKSVTERAVEQLRAYARYIDRHAEAIVGEVDAPNHVTEGGIRVSFELLNRCIAPTVNVSKEYLAIDAMEVCE